MRLVLSTQKDLYSFLLTPNRIPLCHIEPYGFLQAIKVMPEPAVAPAAPKQAIVPRLGYAPFLLTCSSGQKPRCCFIQSE